MSVDPECGFGMAVLEGNVEQIRPFTSESGRNCYDAFTTGVLEEAFEEGRAEEPQREKAPEPRCREPRD